MKLGELLAVLGDKVVSFGGDLSTELCGATPDSRQVRPGMLFCAMKGVRLDGHQFIDGALENGAKAVLLVDVEVSKLTDAVMQRMIYIGGSRANTYLKVAFYEDVEKGGYRDIVVALQEQVKENCKDEAETVEAKLPGTRKSVVKLLQMEAEAQ